MRAEVTLDALRVGRIDLSDVPLLPGLEPLRFAAAPRFQPPLQRAAPWIGRPIPVRRSTRTTLSER
ncbi:MAG: hypothetical protein RMK74_09130 [Myxococcales bacterium]|nr:hypothetical protein [Myxococcales bacterium]